jgi:hypothetical protein
MSCSAFIRFTWIFLTDSRINFVKTIAPLGRVGWGHNMKETVLHVFVCKKSFKIFLHARTIDLKSQDLHGSFLMKSKMKLFKIMALGVKVWLQRKP